MKAAHVLLAALLLPAASPVRAGPTPKPPQKPATPKPPPKKPAPQGGPKIDAVETLLKGLASKDEAIRQKSAEGLVKIGPQATPKLLEALGERREIAPEVGSVIERIWNVSPDKVQGAYAAFETWDPEDKTSDDAFWKAVVALKGKAGRLLDEFSKTPGPRGQAARAAIAPYQAAAKGEGLFLGKAGCAECHKVGREGKGTAGPNLDNLGKTAEDRAQQIFIVVGRRLTGAEFLVESLVAPDAWVQQGYPKGTHPNLRRGEKALTDEEIKTVVAYLQSLGGKPDLAAISIPKPEE